METPYRTYTLGNKRLEIWQDSQGTLNPRRDYDNLGTLLFSHKRYNFGDEKKAKELVGSNDATEMMNYAKRKDVISLPVYMYDHSGQTIKVGRDGNPFNCRWDSGLIGWIVVTKEQVRKDYGWKVINKKRQEQIEKYLETEIVMLDQYMTGDMYGYKVFEDDQETDSCWGFFGTDFDKNGLSENAGEEWSKHIVEGEKFIPVAA